MAMHSKAGNEKEFCLTNYDKNSVKRLRLVASSVNTTESVL